jgi:aromatase
LFKSLHVGMLVRDPLMQIQNRITINAAFEEVFDVTNNIENWPHLFTDIEKAEVLKREGNLITFRITTFPLPDGEARIWKSERHIDKAKRKITARRIEPLSPFAFMEIEWLYREASGRTELVWIHDFELDPESGRSEKQFVTEINRRQKEQQLAVKQFIETFSNASQFEWIKLIRL